MRQCEQCGYLLPEAWDACKRCGAVVAPRADTASSRLPTSTAAVGGGFDPRYATTVRLGLSTTGSVDAMPARGHEPAPVTKFGRTRSSPPALLGVILCIGLAAGGWFGWQYLRSPGSYLHGGGVTYAPDDGNYSIRLPKKPVVATQTLNFGLGPYPFTMAVAAEHGDYQVGVAAVDVGAAVLPEQVDDVLRQSAAGAAVAVPGTELVEQTMTTFDGRPALDAVMSAPDGYDARLLVVVDGTRIVIVVSHAAERNDALFEEARDSLELAP